MKKTLWILLLGGALGLLAPVAPAAHIKLFVLTGQSNSLGTTNGGEADPSSGSDAADQHVKFFWHNVVSASTSIGDSGGVFTNLVDQQGGVYGGSATHWGPEMEFARSLYRAGVRDFGVIKASRGGGGNSLWIKGSGHMYDHVSNTVYAAAANLTASGHTFEVVGLLYLQGESDGTTEAAEAGTRLKALTDNLRVDLPNATNLHTVAAGTTAQGNANDATSRANQAAIAASTSYIDFFPNLDLQDDGLGPDGLHLNKAGKMVVGNRFAQAFLNVGIVSRHYGKLVFIGDSITQGGNGDHPSYRYQVFKNLASNAVPTNAVTGYEFVGSVTGAYTGGGGGSVTTPDVNGQAFVNQHDGHYGWRASWISGRLPIPTARHSNNRGEGTLRNWTGQTNRYESGAVGNWVNYPVPQAGSGNTGTTYIPDTAVVMIGINDIGDGASATQVRDDMGTMIDQLQAANSNISIFISQTLHTDQGAGRKATVDALNKLLYPLTSSKTTASSPVWLIETNVGFDPAVQTYDNVHPNGDGEAHVGDRISAGLGIIEGVVITVSATVEVDIDEKASEDLGGLHFEGSDIYNSGSYASGWSASGDIGSSPTGTSDLVVSHPGAVESTLDGSGTGWDDINSGVWMFEARLKFDANPNGFILWLGTDDDRILVEVYDDRTQDFGGNSFTNLHNNLDGQYHTFTVRHDPAAGLYYVWRDGILLNPGGSPYDQATNDSRLLLGDYTGGAFGNGFNVTVDYIEYRGGYEGNEIYDGNGFVNGWTSVGGIDASVVPSNDLQVANTAAGGSWVEGTAAGWSDINDGYWTFETRLKFNANPNGFVLWLGTGSDIIYVEIYADHTQDTGAETYSAAHNNTDGAFHTFRVGHDSDNAVYHVWRDGERLTPTDGAPYDSGADDERMILGDYTGGTFGNGFDVVIDYARYDPWGVFSPVQEPLAGMVFVVR